MLILSPTSVTKDNLKGKVQRNANLSPRWEEEWTSANIRLTNGKEHKGVSALRHFLSYSRCILWREERSGTQDGAPAAAAEVSIYHE